LSVAGRSYGPVSEQETTVMSELDRSLGIAA